MPIYEYCCEKCGREFEEWQKFSDSPVEKCEECGGRTRRLISHSSFVLKGTGWYVTDYGRKDGGSMSSGSSCKSPKSDSKTTSTEASTSGSSSTE
jgi:putative FmdB family regulatory protein